MSAAERGRRADDGGMVARRAVVRWAWRLFRREWRQQFLVLALLTVATGATILGAATAYNLAPAPGDAEFGTANFFLRFRTRDSNQLDTFVAAAREDFGTIDVFKQEDIPVPGSVERVEFRDQAPTGAFSGPMLALDEGRYPTSDGEVAVTDGVAKTYNLQIGDTFSVGGSRTVVGVVMNPSALNTEFALVAPGTLDEPEALTILVNADSGLVRAFQARGENVAVEISERLANEQFIASASVLLMATVVLLFVSLIAATGFIVLAQRRLRQLGMLAAIGATEKHVRLVMVANGAVIGVVAAALGIGIGLAVWIAIVPLLENAAGYRIDALNVAWWLIVASALLSIGASTLASWWPARSIARVPITMALSGRPPRPRPSRRSFGLAGVLIVGGIACLVLLDPARADPGDGSFGRLDQILLIAGTVATVAGVLFLGPPALSLLAAAAGRLPVALRLALRDLARYQARSGAALAAVTLALGISAAVVITAAAEAEATVEDNLSDSQLLVWTPSSTQPEDVSPGYTGNDGFFNPFLPNLSAEEFEELQAQAGSIAGTLDDATTTALDVAWDTAVPAEGPGRNAVTLVGRTGDGYLEVGVLFVATPELLEHYSVDLQSVDPGIDVLTVPAGEVLKFKELQGVRAEDLLFSTWLDPASGRPMLESRVNVQELTSGYSSLPRIFITPGALESHGWEPVRVGWLIETASPITPGQREAARDLAAQAGLFIEARNEPPSNNQLRSGATAVGILVALSILAMTVGLLRSEASGDLRTLTAVGATGTIRRTVTAATASALALLGALLGTLGAYLVLGTGYFSDAGSLVPVPVLHLLMIALGAPLAAAVAGWLLAGPQPAALARQPIE